MSFFERSVSYIYAFSALLHILPRHSNMEKVSMRKNNLISIICLLLAPFVRSFVLSLLERMSKVVKEIKIKNFDVLLLCLVYGAEKNLFLNWGFLLHEKRGNAATITWVRKRVTNVLTPHATEGVVLCWY